MTHVLYIKVNRSQNVKKQKKLNKDFRNICDCWLADIASTIRFSVVKTKSIPFGSKQRAKNIRKLNIRCKKINTKQKAQITSLRCVLDEPMSGEPMTF